MSKHFRRILLATDFSSSAGSAQDLAANLASTLGAQLHLLHAVVLHGDDVYGLSLPVADLEEHGNRIREAAAERLANLAEAMEEGFGLEPAMEVRRSTHAVTAILEYSQEIDADLIVLGTHGRRGPGRWLLGSVAEEVARRADRAVLTARPLEGSWAADGVRHILVPVDFSQASKESLALARSLAEVWGARIHLLHLVEPVIVPGPYGMLPAGQPVTLEYDVLARRARDQLIEMMEGAPADSYQVQALVGAPRIDIVDLAQRLPADLIVQASRGLTGLPRLFLGSTAEHVLRTSPCPVLTVKAAQPEPT